MDKVMEGMSNKIAKDFKLLSVEKQNIIADRMDVCLNCPYNSRNAKTSDEYRELVGRAYDSERPELHCSLCGCFIEAKTASLSSNCGIEAWNGNNPTRVLELKWTAVDFNNKTDKQ